MHAKRIYLVGPRACGKTTVGRALAERLGWRFADTDELVVRGAGCPIAVIVERLGWDTFRDMESAALTSLSGEEGVVIATGGGMVLREANRLQMMQTGTVLSLEASVEALVARLSADPLAAQRPSLTSKDMATEVAEVLKERGPLYQTVSHSTVDATLPIEKIIGKILEALETEAHT